MAAQKSAEVRQQIGNVAIALSDQRTEMAMDSFDKSFAGYSQLQDYFHGLTAAYVVVNELDFTNEQIEGHNATLMVHWTLTLKDRGTDLTENREQELAVKLSLKKHGWRIVDLSPLDFFNPEPPKSK